MDCQECNLNNENNDTIVVEILELQKWKSVQTNELRIFLQYIQPVFTNCMVMISKKYKQK